MPEAAVVALKIEGLCKPVLNPLGPDQLKLVPISVLPVKSMFEPAQYGDVTPLMETVGVGSITTVWLEVQLFPQASLTVTVKL